MKNPKKTHLRAVQSSSRGKEHPKPITNLRKNSTIFFQAGLIISLLFIHLVFQMEFERKGYSLLTVQPIEDKSPEFVSRNYVIEKKTDSRQTTARKKNKSVPPKITTAPDFVDVPPETEFSSKDEFPEIIDPGSIPKIDDTDNVDEIFDVTNLEQVPIFPGCEKKKTNKDKLKCMSEKLNRIVQKNFDTSIGSEYGLSGTQKIQMAFTINQKGEVIDIQARAPHPILQQEAMRVAKKIPQMEPGKQRYRPVSVAYYLPIIFKVQD
ncbi:energy transducer TonB [Aegicerativicinus sediminis]|uniref:energy transducer TonB n=1 Tax=Aegicerativicinus sediminis TaxID=2893202 RepID=UPI001E4CD2C7|nr:energy transducer TonB [Aegicerativicinus sediminis]